eukprot:CAMPEP_0170503008 /NCGR_PEP_ID=MMETSP0208-20121228/43319_1 /TAXON_ID=197538 /ORGANISM="Strombidium inclinatum, Strain S3" /LENGTH=151 /DNA_ID=CAMNT_0010782419 /DNA_START=444 /DNA_END=898 /DNA_ORIENTATION=-
MALDSSTMPVFSGVINPQHQAVESAPPFIAEESSRNSRVDRGEDHGVLQPTQPAGEPCQYYQLAAVVLLRFTVCHRGEPCPCLKIYFPKGNQLSQGPLVQEDSTYEEQLLEGPSSKARVDLRPLAGCQPEPEQEDDLSSAQITREGKEEQG